MCPLLLHRECSVYPVRPIICRTHGVPVRHRGVGVMPSCTMNFMDRDVDTLDDALVLDADRITENLMRLNLVYCRITGSDVSADQRIALTALL
jgi:Fe-S-cluster containining protein